MTKLVEVYKQLNDYLLREVYVNPKHIVAMRQDDRMTSVLKEGKLPDQLEIKFPYGQKHKNKSISRRVDVIREEVMAWEEGRELATDLGIDIDEKLWHNFIKKNLFDYVRWANDPKTFNDSRQ